MSIDTDMNQSCQPLLSNNLAYTRRNAHIEPDSLIFEIEDRKSRLEKIQIHVVEVGLRDAMLLRV